MDFNFNKGIPKISSALVASTLICSFLDQFTDSFTLLPGYLLSQPWTLLTAGLVENGIITIILNLFMLFFMSKYFEERWGSKEVLKHFLIVSVSTNAITAIIMILQYAFSAGYYDPLFTKIYGTGSFICSLLVAYKRAIPEHKVVIFQKVSIRVKYIPSLNILLHIILFLLGVISTTFYTHIIGIGILSTRVFNLMGIHKVL
jgi:membrane associated rhomboid family serine protease